MISVQTVYFEATLLLQTHIVLAPVKAKISYVKKSDLLKWCWLVAMHIVEAQVKPDLLRRKLILYINLNFINLYIYRSFILWWWDICFNVFNCNYNCLFLEEHWGLWFLSFSWQFLRSLPRLSTLTLAPVGAHSRAYPLLHTPMPIHAHSRSLRLTPAHSRTLSRTPAHSRSLRLTPAHSSSLPWISMGQWQKPGLF